MILGFKLLFYRLLYKKYGIITVDNYFSVAVVFSLMIDCPNFPFHTASLHPVIPESTKGNQSSLKTITVYC